MQDFLVYLFWPNPANAHYNSPKVIVLGVICIALVVAAFVIKRWRNRQGNAVTKKLSRSWSSACLWFGMTGLVLIISRVEEISFVSMRFLWAVWLGITILYVVFQVKSFRSRHYETIETVKIDDPREKYLPKKKRG